MARSDRAKRATDLLLGGFLLVVSLPVQGVIGALVRTSSPGPALYRAVRCGRRGKAFTLYKFRTMTAGAVASGPRITAAGDPRITRVGRFLRRTKLDELPQLWNVVRGDMSLVGPRPEDPRFVGLYTPEQRQVLAVRPGVTGPSQLAFRHEERMLGEDPEAQYVHEILPRKSAIDLEYVRTQTFTGDARILLETLRAILS